MKRLDWLSLSQSRLTATDTSISYWWHRKPHPAKIALVLLKKSHFTERHIQIRCDVPIFFCAQQLTGSQLSLPHITKNTFKITNTRTKNRNRGAEEIRNRWESPWEAVMGVYSVKTLVCCRCYCPCNYCSADYYGYHNNDNDYNNNWYYYSRYNDHHHNKIATTLIL